MPKIKYINKYETFYRFSEDAFAEMIYDPDNKKTAFLIRDKSGNVVEKEKVMLGEETDEKGDIRIIMLKPLPWYDDWLKTNFVKLPTRSNDKYKSKYDLYKEIKKFIGTYVELPKEFVSICAVYVMLSWLHDKFYSIPYLRVIGMYGTGKTRFLSVVASVCYRPMIAGGSTTSASLFRTVDKVKGTFALDEADFRNSEMWSDIVKILNSGYSKGMPAVRMETKKNYMVAKAFEVYGPKILASREQFEDSALESRCITQYILPKNKKEISAPTHLPADFEKEARKLRDKLLSFRFSYYHSAGERIESLPDEISFSRLREISLAMTSMAQIIDKSVLKEVCEYLKMYEKNMDIESMIDIKADVVKCIVNMVINYRINDALYDCDKLRIGSIADEFKKMFNGYYDKKTFSETVSESTDRQSGESFTHSTAYEITPRKMGEHIKKLNIRIVRDSEGRYIPIPQEYQKIRALVNRYGLDEIAQLPEVLPPKKEKDRGDSF